MNNTKFSKKKIQTPMGSLGALRRHDGYTTVYIGNMSFKKTKEQIKTLFQKFGGVSFVNIILDPKTERSKGYAFVQMKTSTAALKAIENLNGLNLDGRTLKVSIAQESETRKFNAPKMKESETEIEKNPKPQAKKRKRDKGLKVLMNFLGK